MSKDKKSLEEESKEQLEKIDSWRKLQFNIDENYDYIPKKVSFKIASNLLYFYIAFPILKLLTKIIYDLKIEGKENIRNLNQGAITISNHVLVLDCAMIGIACEKKKVYFTALEDSFKIPFVRKLIKLLNAIPIPTNREKRNGFINALDILLEDKKIVHFYPEASLMPYCKEIRNFKSGAFVFSIRNNVPIVPMIFTFREPKGIRRIFKKKLDVTLKILKPVSPNDYNSLGEFKTKVFELMKISID